MSLDELGAPPSSPAIESQDPRTKYRAVEQGGHLRVFQIPIEDVDRQAQAEDDND
jgi:hypothetical protein